MPKVRLELKQETFDKLLKVAVADRRPVDWQAEVLLERALGIRTSDEARGEDADASHGSHVERQLEPASAFA